MIVLIVACFVIGFYAGSSRERKRVARAIRRWTK
jgi:hypothetical protein